MYKGKDESIMAVSLFRMAVSATSNIQTRPSIKRYLYPLAYSDISGGANSNVLVIPRSKFTSDTGGIVSILRPIASNGYNLLELNGIVQESGTYKFSIVGSYIQKVIISGVTSNLFNEGTPVALIINNFSPTATTTIKA